MAYQKQQWRDGDTETPLSAARLMVIENGIAAADATATSAQRVAVETAQLVQNTPSVDLTPINTRLDNIDGNTAGTLKKRVEALEARPTGEGGGQSVDLTPINDRLSALERDQAGFREGEEYISQITYYWPDWYETNSSWNQALDYEAPLGFVVLNRRSGDWVEYDKDFHTQAKRAKARGATPLFYVRCAFGYVADRQAGEASNYPNWETYTHDAILEQVQHVLTHYGDVCAGIFLDEYANGWGNQANRFSWFKQLYDKVKARVGNRFVVGNPGSNTPETWLQTADVLMTFESSAEKYLSDEKNGGAVHPEHYQTYPSTRFWHLVHDVTQDNIVQVADRARELGVSHLCFTDRTFEVGNGNIHNPQFNPYDRVPSKWIREAQAAWASGNLTTYRRVVELSKNTGAAGIRFVASEEEAAKLPIGTLYAIVAATKPIVVGVVGENLNASTFRPTIDGAKAGDKIIIAVNTKAVSNMTVTPPSGFVTAVDGYWAGTQRSWLFTGEYVDDLTVTVSESAEIGYAAMAIRGTTALVVGTPKDRQKAPAENLTVTAPEQSSNSNDLVLGFAFERTSARETEDQVTVSEGWEKIHFTAQGTNYQTVTVAKGGKGALTVTYPNSQQTNGLGVQVVARG